MYILMLHIVDILFHKFDSTRAILLKYFKFRARSDFFRYRRSVREFEMER
jgi:hypothetical protein